MIEVQPDPGPFKLAKFRIIQVLRKTGFLKLADTLRFQLARLRVRSRNRSFLLEHPALVPPPASLAYDAYNHMDWRVYWESGQCHAKLFSRIICEASDAEKIDVLEWGCGPGRIIRHLGGFLGSRQGTLSGSDYNSKTIEWCQASLEGISFSLNGLHPPLPYDDNAFDVVYNFSVFTHLSTGVQLEWARELLRILRPGGILICTTHGVNYLYMLSTADERESYARGECIDQSGYKEGAKWFFSIHPESFVVDKLLEGYIDHRRIPAQDADGFLQDIWVARKPAPIPA